MVVMITEENKLGNEIKRLLDMRGWSQRTLASNANIGQSTVSKIIRGETGTTPETINAIANALEVSPIRLMQIAGIPLPVIKQEERTSSVEYLARRLDALPIPLQKKAFDIINPQIDLLYEMGELSSGLYAKKEADTLHVSQERLDSEIIEILPPEAIYVVNRVQEHDEVAYEDLMTYLSQVLHKAKLTEENRREAVPS